MFQVAVEHQYLSGIGARLYTCRAKWQALIGRFWEWRGTYRACALKCGARLRGKKKEQVPPRFELGSWDSESQVLTVTPRNQQRAPWGNYLFYHVANNMNILAYGSTKSGFTTELSIGVRASKLSEPLGLFNCLLGMGNSEWWAGRGGVKKYGCSSA